MGGMTIKVKIVKIKQFRKGNAKRRSSEEGLRGWLFLQRESFHISTKPKSWTKCSLGRKTECDQR